MKATLWLIIIGVLSSCSASKKLVEKQKENKSTSTRESVKEVVTEPLTGYIEVPVDCPETLDKPARPKTYEIHSGATRIKAQLQGNILKLKAESKGGSSKEHVIEKIVTLDKIHYRDKVKRVPYIPKWAWALLAFNVVYFAWRYKKLLLSLWVK